MKNVKLIYFPVIALLILVFTVMSFVHTLGAGDRSNVSEAFVENVAITTNSLIADRERSSGSDLDSTEAVRATVIDRLKTITYSDGTGIQAAGNFTLQKHDLNGNETDETYKITHYTAAPDKAVANYVIQTEVVGFDTVSKMDSLITDDSIYAYAGKTVNNIVVYIPGTRSVDAYKNSTDNLGDAILFTAHMDSEKILPVSQNASDTVMVAAMLEEIEAIIKGGRTYENDLVFLFTDSRYDSNLGINVFMNQFYGFRENRNDYKINIDEIRYENDLTNRIKLAVNFDSLGIGSSSMLLQTSEDNAAIVSEYAKAMGANFSNSFVSDILKDYQSDFSSIKNINSLNLVTFGKLYGEGTYADSLDNLSKAQIRELAAKKGSMLRSAVEHFGGLNLKNLNSNKSAVYFSFLGMGTISSSMVAAYVLGGVLLAMLIAAVVINIFRKGFDLRALARGAAAALLAVAATMLATLLLYLLSALILSGFGAFTVQSIITLAYSNPALIIGFSLFTAAMIGLFTSLLKNVLSVKATDTVRGGAVIVTLVSAVLCFAVPSLGFVTAIPAMFVAAVLIVTAAFKAAYKQKYSEDIERMMLYLIPVAVALPMLLPMTMALTMLTPAIMLPVTMLPITAILMLCAPYLVLLKPLMNKLLAKLPKRTIRVQRTVTKNVEDPAKKGKFTEFTGKEITKEKINWKYRHGIGMTVLAVAAAIIIMISGGVKMPIGASVYGLNSDRQSVTSSLFDDSVLVSWIFSGGSADTNIAIYDKAVYKDLRYAVSGYEWNSGEGAYTKDFKWSSDIKIPVITGGSGKVQVKPAINGLGVGYCEISISNASGIETIKVLDVNDDVIMRITNTERKANIVVAVPYSDNTLSSINLDVEFYSANTARAVNMVYRQYAWYSSTAFLDDKSDDFGKIKTYLSENDLQKAVRFGMYFEYPINVTV